MALGGREPRGTPEAINKSPGVVFHAEFDFQVKTSQYMVKMMKNNDFFKIFLIFWSYGGVYRKILGVSEKKFFFQNSLKIINVGTKQS